MANEPKGPLRTYTKPHLNIERFQERADYRPPRRAVTSRDGGLDRFSHGTKLSGELAQAFAAAHRLLGERDPDIAAGDAGVYVEIASPAETLLPDIGWQQKGIRIGAVRTEDNGEQVGGLFVPQRSEAFLTKALDDYTSGGGSAAAKDRLEKIERIGPSSVATLWFDRRPLPPEEKAIWWECWCWKDRADHVPRPAQRLGLRVSERRLIFPDCEVVPVYGTRSEIERLLVHTDAIERLRHASDSPHVFLSELRDYQVPLIRDLASRISHAPATAPAACVLDSGTNRAHPLLSASLDPSDQHAVDEKWGVDDHYDGGHGTQMSGLALLGDLTHPVGDQRSIELKHRLETVTILPPEGFDETEPASYGYVTQQAINLPEIAAPERTRIFCMAVTNKDVPGDRPTSWSAAVDQAAAGKMPGERDAENTPRRLILISGGNIGDDADYATMTAAETPAMEDPVQAWNALGISGFTDRDTVIDALFKSHVPIAKVGDRSPYSRTSVLWPDTMPLKPEVVFEAGNRAASPSGTNILSGVESLSVLTTSSDFVSDPLTAFFATSASTGEAARFTAALQAEHPAYWPETIRALTVHSAQWTPRMLERIAGARKKKSAHLGLARQFGFGVPNLQRAMASASADLALVAQAVIQPFKRKMKQGKKGRIVGDGDPRFSDIHLYTLPWPKETLRQLGEKRVALKITLSYFIEPSPGQLKPVTPARYRSHGLRFDMQRRNESDEAFKSRINDLAAASDVDDDTDTHAGVVMVDEEVPGLAEIEVGPESDTGWMFGSRSRAADKPGSLHCDIWQGNAIDLADRHMVAIYPVAGWWKYRVPQHRYNEKTRYALVMTLDCVEQDVDLYAEIEAGIAAAVAAPAISA
ncbi:MULTISPECIES: S8 family peptidase [Rhodomicrobium]|uniref:S8 family peptidase n=1 Tax=Rhodomicrobium TaxID=1068 RepID=UPI000B4AC8BB|nr:MULTISPECIES: S8 family peptidase [Rhodomicrobium]